ncbi:MAG: diphthamide synthesis protein, partial [Euryarchaeota archaeon]|nr:diphthamide synthesis protein [Euryarchaeota archaeon]
MSLRAMSSYARMSNFEFELDRVIAIIEERGAKKIGLQFPEGLRRSALQMAKKIEERTGAIVLISGNPCHGACDVDEFLRTRVDVLFHFGHAEMEPMDKVVFIEVRSNADVIPVLEQAIKMLKGRRIGLITTVQHVHKLGEARD